MTLEEFRHWIESSITVGQLAVFIVVTIAALACIMNLDGKRKRKRKSSRTE